MGAVTQMMKNDVLFTSMARSVEATGPPFCSFMRKVFEK